MPFYSQNLRDSEQIIAIIRRNWITSLPKILIIILLFFVTFFFMFPLLAWGIAGQIIFSLLLAIAVLYLLKFLVLSYYNCLVITTERLIDFSQKNSLERKVQEADFLDISEVSYQIKGILQILSRSGNLMIKIKGGGENPNIIIKGINTPAQIQNLILDLKRLAITEKEIQHTRSGVQESYREILAKMKSDIGREGLTRLMDSLSEKNDSETETKSKSNVDLDFLK